MFFAGTVFAGTVKKKKKLTLCDHLYFYFYHCTSLGQFKNKR